MPTNHSVTPDNHLVGKIAFYANGWQRGFWFSTPFATDFTQWKPATSDNHSPREATEASNRVILALQEFSALTDESNHSLQGPLSFTQMFPYC